MIRIINKLFIKSFDTEELMDVPFIPATATLEINSSMESSGRVMSFNINAVVSKDLPIFRDNLSLTIYFDNGDNLILGTLDFPVTFTIDINNSINLSANYQLPDGVVLSN